ncbi:hypothetical protein [Priestia koreensis]|uniref:hypothetical protein n=1 Tax=Priestia koreensis TaxID=284581 RepID=UPI003458E411
MVNMMYQLIAFILVSSIVMIVFLVYRFARRRHYMIIQLEQRLAILQKRHEGA